MNTVFTMEESNLIGVFLKEDAVSGNGGRHDWIYVNTLDTKS